MWISIYAKKSIREEIFEKAQFFFILNSLEVNTNAFAKLPWQPRCDINDANIELGSAASESVVNPQLPHRYKRVGPHLNFLPSQPSPFFI